MYYINSPYHLLELIWWIDGGEISIFFSSSPSNIFVRVNMEPFSYNLFFLFAMLENLHAFIFLFGGSISYLLFGILEGVRQRVLLW